MHFLNYLIAIVLCLAGASLLAWPSLVLVSINRKLKKAAAENAKYAQIPAEDWTAVKALLGSTPPWVDARKYAEDRAEVDRLSRLAQQAYDVCVGLIPDSAISASKVGGTVVTTGFPDLDPAAFIKK